MVGRENDGATSHGCQIHRTRSSIASPKISVDGLVLARQGLFRLATLSFSMGSSSLTEVHPGEKETSTDRFACDRRHETGFTAPNAAQRVPSHRKRVGIPQNSHIESAVFVTSSHKKQYAPSEYRKYVCCNKMKYFFLPKDISAPNGHPDHVPSNTRSTLRVFSKCEIPNTLSPCPVSAVPLCALM